jgi:cytochrome c-type biogenesis protein CcmH/NrfG
LLLFQNYKEATAIYQLIIQENPNDASGYFYLGKTYEKWQKFDDAIKAYQIAVSKGKNSRPAIDAAFQIKYLKGLH